MNWEAIGAVAELAGATAVFISLIYLASQIRNSKRSDQVIAASQAASATSDWVGQMVRDSELNDLYMRGAKDFSSLSFEEKNRYAWLILQLLRSIEGIWLLYQSKAIDDEYWRSYVSVIDLIIRTPGSRRCYERNRQVLDPRFAQVVDDILNVGENGGMKATSG